ncbi:MAG: PDZ domain-containing protein, partial [Luteolibacter sp.]
SAPQNQSTLDSADTQLPLPTAVPVAPVNNGANGQPTISDIPSVVAQVEPAVVTVINRSSANFGRTATGSGSGAIISADGYIITNHHVAGRGTRFVCTLSNREEVDAHLIGTDALSDLAVLKLDLATRRNPDAPLTVAEFGDSDTLQVGDVVFAMGSPAGLSQSVTRGIVANTAMIVPPHQVAMRLDGEAVGELVRWIGHDAVIYPGNSGGPLVNPQGEIIGINEVGIASLGGAIPSNLAKNIAAELISKGHVTRSWIGIEVQSLMRGDPNGRGALVSTVWNDSPAAQAGIQPGDMITRYHGKDLPDCHAAEDLPIFNAMVLETPPNTEVVLEGFRDGKPQRWTLQTVERQPVMAREDELRDWGITARDFTTLSALEKFRESTDGVLVDTVRTGGPSAMAKPPLRPGDVIHRVNGKAIASRKELLDFTSSLVGSASEPVPVLVEFERERQEIATVVKVGPEKDPKRPRIAEKAWFGATTQVLTEPLAIALNLAGKKGVRITSLLPGSPAEAAGIEVGDLLLKLDQRVINARRPEDSEVFSELIVSYPVDATIELEGRRGDEAMKWSVQLAPRPVDDGSLVEYKDELFEFTVRELSSRQRDLARQLLGKEPEGLSVIKVETNGWASLGGFAPDDIILNVNGQPVNDIDTLKSILRGMRDSRPRSVVFGIRRGPRTTFLEVEPRW